MVDIETSAIHDSRDLRSFVTFYYVFEIKENVNVNENSLI